MSADAHPFDDLPAYALGSLTEQEARLVAEHLTGCHVCRAELEAYQSAADAMLLAVPAQEPPSDLKPRLLARIRKSTPESRSRPAAARAPRRLIQAGAFLGLVVIVILGLSNLLLWQRVQKMEVLVGPLGMRAIALQNTVEAPAASGFVVISADGMNGALVVDHLRPLDPGHEYQLWLTRGGQATSGAVFSVDASGYRGLRVTAPESLLTYTDVFVTVEAAGGSDQPTGERVLRGSLFNPKP
jgi:anti-sigma-K factor RskA